MNEILGNLLEDLPYFLGAVLFELAVIFIPQTLKHKGIISSFVARKIIHGLAGLAVFIAPYMHYPILAVLLSGASVIFTRKSAQKAKAKVLKNLYDAIHEDEEVQLGYLQGPFAYSLAITLLTFAYIFFPTKYYFPISAILIMMYSDTLASVFGRRYGKHYMNVPWVGAKRSLEGSLAFFLSALVFSGLTFWLFGQVIPGNSTILTTSQVILFMFVMTISSTLLEVVSPSKYDDFIVPIGAAIIGSCVAAIIGIW